MGRILDQTRKSDGERDGLAGCTNEEQVTSTHTLDQEERWDGKQGVDGCKDTAQDQGQSWFQTNGFFEQDGGVVNGSVTTGELLEELGGRGDESSLQILGFATGEQVLDGSFLVSEAVDGVLDHGCLSDDGVVRDF